MKDMGKSSSRKLRHVINYTLYRMDPQKTLYKISFSVKFINIHFFLKILGKSVYIPPLTPDQKQDVSCVEPQFVSCGETFVLGCNLCPCVLLFALCATFVFVRYFCLYK